MSTVEHLDIGNELTITIEDGLARWSPRERESRHVLESLRRAKREHYDRIAALERAERAVFRTEEARR